MIQGLLKFLINFTLRSRYINCQMYNPRSKVRKLNSPFPFPTYVVKGYSTQTPDQIKGLKIDSQKIKSQLQSEGKLQRKHNKSESSQKIIRKSNNSSQALDQIYNLIYANSYQPPVKNSSTEKEIKEIGNKNYESRSPKPGDYINEVLLANAEIYKQEMQLTNQIQAAMSSLNVPPNNNGSSNNRKNLYRTREHKPTKSLSPTKKSVLYHAHIVASFRHAHISLYSLLNRKEDYFSMLKNRQVESLYPPFKGQQIEQVFKKYLQTKGRDKGRVKYNYLTSEQLRSMKYKSNVNKPSNQNVFKKEKKEKIQQDDEQEQQDDVEGEQKPQLMDYATWKRKNGVGQNQKVFIVKGGYGELRKALREKGWCENDDVWSPYFDFKWTTKIVDIDYMNLRTHQTVNHFNNNQHLTSKYGITRRLKTLYLSHQIDIDKFYPRCYDLADLTDFQNFIEDFKFGFAETVVKRFLFDKKRYQKKELKVRVAYDILKRRNVNFKLLVQEINKGSFHFIKPQEWEVLTQIVEFQSEEMQEKLRQIRKKQSVEEINLGDKSLVEETNLMVQPTSQNTTQALQAQIFQQQPPKLQKKQTSNEDLTFKKLHGLIDNQLKKLQATDPQYEMNGFRNVWITKPQFLSRGRGIRCYNNLYDIMTYCCGGTGTFVAQKYIENPLLIDSKKFDIRQWVMIQDYNPPKIWFYDECYIRFCADDYSLQDIHNKFQHLTNNSIQKYNKNHIVDKSMWEKREFIEFVGQDKWDQIVEKIKNIVVWTIRSCEGFVIGRKGNCELVGYDFMIDQNLNPWLIQINMSPSMEYSTSITKKLVKMVLQDSAKLIASPKKSMQVGLFKCIYKSPQDSKKFQKYKI